MVNKWKLIFQNKLYYYDEIGFIQIQHLITRNDNQVGACDKGLVTNIKTRIQANLVFDIIYQNLLKVRNPICLWKNCKTVLLKFWNIVFYLFNIF